MKKHEHQTSRLEKMSNFFGGSNFLRLNNYNKLEHRRLKDEKESTKMQFEK